MSITTLANPIYQINFWGDSVDGGATIDGPDVAGWERALSTDIFPVTDKGMGTYKFQGEFGWDVAPIRQGYRPAFEFTNPLGSTWHLVHNMAAAQFDGGREFKVKVPPGTYQVTVSMGDPSFNSQCDVVVNNIVFHGGPVTTALLEVTKTVPASGGFIIMSLGKNDPSIPATVTLVNWMTISPLVYDGGEFPTLSLATVDPASEAGQPLVAALTQRDTALRERNIKFPVPVVAVDDTGWKTLHWLKVYVPMWANLLHVGVHGITSNNIGAGNGAFIRWIVDPPKLDAFFPDVTHTDSVLDNGDGTFSVGNQEYTLQAGETKDNLIDVRRSQGREVFIRMDGEIIAPGQTCIWEVSEQYGRWRFEPNFHANDLQLRGVATFAASGSVT